MYCQFKLGFNYTLVKEENQWGIYKYFKFTFDLPLTGINTG